MGASGQVLAGKRGVSRRREVERSLGAFREIRSILDAMRNLAVLETRKIARFRAAQRRALDTLAAAAADLAEYHAPPRAAARALPLWVLIGSERGFCGDLNEALVREWQARHAGGGAALVAVGTRLVARLPEGASALPVAGAGIAEEVNSVISALADQLRSALERAARGAVELSVLYHDPDTGAPQLASLLPFPGARERGRHGTPPLLNLPPVALLAELGARHLLAQLQALLYDALAAENERRLRHMDAAIRRLDDETTRLRAQRNRLRQEEITEEIEVLMLSAERLCAPLDPDAAPGFNPTA